MNNSIENAKKVAMEKRLYAIRDDKQREFNPPVVICNDAVALRSFGDMVNQDKNSPLYKHCGDFSLWYLGNFNSETGVFSTPEDSHIIARASDFVMES